MLELQPLIFGEVLFDCFPDSTQVLGGAPFNVAWHLQAFGKKPLLVSGVGDDREGRSILTAMQAWRMRTDGVLIDAKRPTGKVQVTFHDNEPVYEIVDNSAWDLRDLVLPPGKAGTLLYHGSLALRHQPALALVQQYREAAELVFVDINLRSPWYSRESVHELIRHIDWLKLNENELLEILPGQNHPDDAVRQLHAEYGIDNIVVTRGERGAVLSRQGMPPILTPQHRAVNFVDSVGAGDAFSSVLLLGILSGWTPELILQRAQQFAAAIVGVRGATVRDMGFYETIMAQWARKNH
jgi:fructokinase